MVRWIRTDVLVHRWRKRRREIIKAALKALGPEVFSEFRKLGRLIKELSVEGAKESTRKPLSVHRANLIRYLGEHGPATRREMTNATGVPPGSLSQLLKARQEVEQVQHGVWKLKATIKNIVPATLSPGTIDDPASRQRQSYAQHAT